MIDVWAELSKKTPTKNINEPDHKIRYNPISKKCGVLVTVSHAMPPVIHAQSFFSAKIYQQQTVSTDIATCT